MPAPEHEAPGAHCHLGPVRCLLCRQALPFVEFSSPLRVPSTGRTVETTGWRDPREATQQEVLERESEQLYAWARDRYRANNPASAAILDNPCMVWPGGTRVTIQNHAVHPAYSVYDGELLISLGILARP